jgi:hypothetical protein
VDDSSSAVTFEMYALGKTYEIVVDDTVPVFKPVESQSFFVMAEGI